MTAKFSGKKSANLAPFAEQTINMVGSMDYTMSDHEVIYLRSVKEFIKEDKPFDRYFELENQIEGMLKGMVAYSIQLVAISEQKIDVAAKANALADMIVTLTTSEHYRRVIPADSDEIEFEEIIKAIRGSESYLQALQNAQPLINYFSGWSGKVLDALREEKMLARTKIVDAIDSKYASAIAFNKTLRRVRNDHYDSLVSLARYAETNESKYLDELRNSPIIAVQMAIKGKKSLGGKELLTLHGMMTERMGMINENFEQLTPDIEAYHKSLMELDRLLERKSEAIKGARLTFIFWSRAHGKMASGVVSPAEWFDISDTGSLIFQAAGKAIGL